MPSPREGERGVKENCRLAFLLTIRYSITKIIILEIK